MTISTIETLLNHKSIRSFQDKKIEPEIIKEILKCGIRTATAGNLQHYSLIVIDDKEKIKKLGGGNAPLVIVALADTYRIKKWFEVYKVADPVMDTTRQFFIANWDALITLHSISIAAEALGLGTYYYGDIISENVTEILGTPELSFPAGMLCLGYPNEEKGLSDRLPLDAVVHYNSYSIPTNEEIQTWYSEKENLFQTRNSKERLEELSKKNINNLAGAYANAKFTSEFNNKVSLGIIENIKRSGYKI